MTNMFLHCELGDKKSSQLLSEITSLASGQMSNKYIILLWFSKLPTTVAQVIRGFSEKLLPEELTSMADGMLTGKPTSSDIAAVKSRDESSCAVVSLKKKIHKLLQIIEQHNNNRSRSTNRHFDFSPARFPLKSRSSPSRELCYYHQRYREHANKCIPPCAYGNTFTEKRKRQLMATNDFSPSTFSHLFICDRKSEINYLVDSGTDISLSSTKKQFKSKSKPLYAANGTQIVTFEDKIVTLDFRFLFNFI